MSDWRAIESAPEGREVLVCQMGMLGSWQVAVRNPAGEWTYSNPTPGRPDVALPLLYWPTHWASLPSVPAAPTRVRQ